MERAVCYPLLNRTVNKRYKCALRWEKPKSRRVQAKKKRTDPSCQKITPIDTVKPDVPLYLITKTTRNLIEI